ncbi:MAG TPA: helix-turn-helix transcriptional regulator [Thermoanaerobaculia bacterium]|nr:helix-turn-helix transcriptional regulator [Thermoanaerobaculia bacterium]
MPPENRVAHQVGRALRRLRLDQDFLMKQVAGRAGITVSMLSRYEHGRGCPSLPNLVKILRALDCTAEEFGNTLGPWRCLP